MHDGRTPRCCQGAVRRARGVTDTWCGRRTQGLGDSYNFLDSYDEIILASTLTTRTGQRAVAEMCDVFAGKIKVMRFDTSIGKDANDYIKAGKKQELQRLMFDAKPFTPDGRAHIRRAVGAPQS